jgi:hypothetical protein
MNLHPQSGWYQETSDHSLTTQFPALKCRARFTSFLAARGESTISRAPGYCGQDQGARRRRCGAIVDDEQRRYCPQYPGAQRVPAAQGHLLRWRSSTIIPHRLRRAAWHLPLRRSERGLLYFHHGLLGDASRIGIAFSSLSARGGGLPERPSFKSGGLSE